MDDPADLAARVRRLEDVEAIRMLHNRYHSCVNNGRFNEVGSLFTADAVAGRYDDIYVRQDGV